MAIQTIPGGLWIPPTFPSATAIPGFGSINTLSTAALWCGVVFQVPKTGTLDWFEWRQNANTNTPDNGLRFSFQDVDANGVPDNTEDQFAIVTAGFAAGAWLVPAGYMGSTGTGTGTKRSVTRGDWLACVVRIENFVASDSVAMSNILASGNFALDIDPQLRYVVTTSNSGTSWVKSAAGLPSMALRYDDGTYAEISWPFHPASVINSRVYNNSSTPDERGLLFQLPFPARISGVSLRIDIDNACDIVLYNAADAIIASASLTSGRRVTTSGVNTRVNFNTPVNLSRNVDYRVTVLPTTASSINIYDFDVNVTALLQAVDGGSTWMSTQRTNAGAWTNVNTNRPYIGLILDGFDDAVSAGSGEHSSVF